MKRQTLEQLTVDLAARTPVVRLVWLDDGRERLLYPSDDARPDDLDEESWEACAVALARGRSRLVESAGLFIHAYPPPLQLFIIGAGHIAQSLSALARTLDWAVTVIDPRGAFSTRTRFPDASIALSSEWPAEALGRVRLDARSALVTCSHDPKVDDPGLVAALATDAFYVGALGSRRTHGARLQRLGAAGISEAKLARIHAPVGLDIGAKTPAEIGVSVVAQIVGELRAS